MNDYLYSSARVRAMESALIGRERIEVLLGVKSTAELWDRLREFGVTVVTDPESREPLREETLLGILRGAYAAVEEMLPNDRYLALWRYRYDCNNVKAAIKGFARGIDPRSMMFDFGTVGVDDVIRMVETGSLEALPNRMRAAAVEATTVYAKTQDPQSIDLLLDRACFADMLSAAVASGCAFAEELVRTMIDLTNILMTVRLLRMKRRELGPGLLRNAMLEGGWLSRDEMEALYASGELAMWERLLYSRYDRFAEAVRAGNGTLSAIERAADNTRMHRLRDAKMIAFGPEVMIAFLLAHEAEVQNLRILFAGREAGLSAETLRERMRDSYV